MVWHILLDLGGLWHHEYAAIPISCRVRRTCPKTQSQKKDSHFYNSDIRNDSDPFWNWVEGQNCKRFKPHQNLSLERCSRWNCYRSFRLLHGSLVSQYYSVLYEALEKNKLNWQGTRWEIFQILQKNKYKPFCCLDINYCLDNWQYYKSVCSIAKHNRSESWRVSW